MTETTAGALAQVTELDEERRRFEGWLAQLEERRAVTPAHVFERVHGDYTTRLDDVLGRLAGHAEMLRGAVDDLARRVEELRSDEQRCSDERAEGELRAAVGEYSQEQWAEIEARTDATLADLVAERQQVEAEHSRLEQVLGLAVPVPAPAEDAAHVSSDVTGVAHASDELAASATGGEGARAQGVVTSADDDDESDVVLVETLAPTPTPADLPHPLPEPPADAGSWTRGLGMTSAPGRGGLGSPPSSLEGERMLDDQRSVSPSPLTADSGTPQIKTLKCQECGTMNYPTEWYCERCGGELSAL